MCLSSPASNFKVNVCIQNNLSVCLGVQQGGTICGAIKESSRSLKSIDKRVFINFRDKYAVFTNFRDKNAVFTRFRDKNYVFEVHDKNTVFGFNFVCSG